MSEPQAIWRLGRWIVSRRSGTLMLHWSDGDLTLRVRNGQVVSIEGVASSTTEPGTASLEVAPVDALAAVHEVAGAAGASETEVVGKIKAALEGRLRAWMLDPLRTLETTDEEPSVADVATISLTHALVELILSEEDPRLAEAVLPDLNVLLRRVPGFLEAYAPLRLTEEADLIVAKITGQRTAAEIAERSPHGSEEVGRLMAALVAAGLLEPVPVAAFGDLGESVAPLRLEEQASRGLVPRRWWIAVAVAVFVVIVAVAGIVLTNRSQEPAAQGRWGIVVDTGCQPQDLQRILRKAGQHPGELTAQRRDLSGGEPCWQLVWGDYASPDAAKAAAGSVPDTLVHEGLTPSVVALTRSDGQAERDGEE